MQLQYEIDKKAIGKRLQSERHKNGHTQESLSEAMGITSKYLSKVENGAAAPSLPFIMKFSEVTGSDLNYLLLGTFPKTEETIINMVREGGKAYDDVTAGLSEKGRRICDEMVKKLAGVLKENKI